MLKAMKSQLSLLAIENGESFAAQINKRVKTKQAQVAISKSLNLIRIMPDLLKRLIADPNDLFHNHVRARIGKKATDHFEHKVKEFILRMPSVVSRIDKMLVLEKEGSVVDRLAKYLLIYLYDPMDFLPEKDKGLFGYLDDAYFVAIVYLMILEKIDPSLKVSEDEQMKEWIYMHLESVRYLIPDESRKIDKTVSDIVTNQILCYPVTV